MRGSSRFEFAIGAACLVLVAGAVVLFGWGLQRGSLPPKPSAPPVCRNDAIQRATNLARASVPGSLSPSDRRVWLRGFIIKSYWRLFDADHDGRLTFDEYLDGQWASELVEAPAGECVITRERYLDATLGRKDEPDNYRSLPYQEQISIDLFNQMDRNKKGYITREDLAPRSVGSFDHSDRLHLGYLTHEDF